MLRGGVGGGGGSGTQKFVGQKWPDQIVLTVNFVASHDGYFGLGGRGPGGGGGQKEICTGLAVGDALGEPVVWGTVRFWCALLPLPPSPIGSITHSLPLPPSLTRSLTHSLARSLNHSLNHSVTHPITHSLARSLARSIPR